MEAFKDPEEIDLLKLSIRVVKSVSANFKFILICFALGFFVGLLKYFTSSKVFESKMLINSEILTQSYTKKLVDDTNKLLNTGYTDLLSKKFNLSQSDIQKIVEIKIEDVTEKPDALKESEKVNFVITAQVKDRKLLPTLQKALIQYLENNEFVKIRVEQKRRNYISILKRIDDEIVDLEEFKTKIYKGNFFETVKGNINFNPTDVNSKILSLRRERLDYENKLELINSVQVIDGFSEFNTPVSPKLSSSIITGFVTGLILVIFFFLYKGLLKILRLSEEE